MNMAYNPKIHNRRSIRLKGYDYSQAGLYYITICVQNRECLFGKIVGAHPRGRPEKGQRFREGQPQGIAPTGIAPTGIAPTMQLNDAGKMVHNEWLDIPNRFPQIQLHEFIVMPNHFHAIMEIVGAPLVGARNRADAPKNADAQNMADASNMANTPMDENISDGENENNQSKIEHGQPQEKGQPQGFAPTGKTVGDVVGRSNRLQRMNILRG